MHALSQVDNRRESRPLMSKMEPALTSSIPIIRNVNDHPSGINTLLHHLRYSCRMHSLTLLLLSSKLYKKQPSEPPPSPTSLDNQFILLYALLVLMLSPGRWGCALLSIISLNSFHLSNFLIVQLPEATSAHAWEIVSWWVMQRRLFFLAAVHIICTIVHFGWWEASSTTNNLPYDVFWLEPAIIEGCGTGTSSLSLVSINSPVQKWPVNRSPNDRIH
jgi:hypothetical protein